MFFGLFRVNGKVHHFGICKKGNYYELVADEGFPSIESLIAFYSRTGFLTEEKITVKLTSQLIPDK